MEIEKLISELQEIQKKHPGINVHVFDYRKNLGGDYGDGSYEGIYGEIEVCLMELKGEEAEFYEEQNDKKFIPWVGLSFQSDDYNDDGKLIAEQ